ncbi:holo-ACP synthase [Buchnera aphidicola]|uniref:Holo-[acyl-carrier-protein] synthase n=1 Tax=Buchnera aphidicola (Therioaphis trifolii) TaxID=1241884 RepID=A0A4D6YDN9_9GAMM|nr:holo-ACP synthase [Buchnera aphidicola]QCI27172.1 holo-ACP synthase [Buchnera aphidicola (Therioaphis trifolii)]
MSIIGIGCDIIDLNRLNNVFKKFGKKFLKKILSKNELNEFLKTKNKINFIGKRFVIKEAASKSIGTGFQNGINFKSFELSHDKYGKPNIIFLKKAKKIFNKLKIKYVHVSITDEKKYIFAVIIIER